MKKQICLALAMFAGLLGIAQTMTAPRGGGHMGGTGHMGAAHMGGGHVAGARISGAHVEGARISGKHISGARVSGTRVTGTRVSDGSARVRRSSASVSGSGGAGTAQVSNAGRARAQGGQHVRRADAGRHGRASAGRWHGRRRAYVSHWHGRDRWWWGRGYWWPTIGFYIYADPGYYNGRSTVFFNDTPSTLLISSDRDQIELNPGEQRSIARRSCVFTIENLDTGSVDEYESCSRRIALYDQGE